MTNPNGPNAEEMGLTKEDMQTPEQREREPEKQSTNFLFLVMEN